MNWLSEVSDPRRLLEECVALEQIRYSVHFNTLLGLHKLSRLRVLKQLKRSRRAAAYDYLKGADESPRYGFVATRTSENEALTFEVAFERDANGRVQLWIQEFHP